MSWNWYRSTSFQIRSSSALGYAAPDFSQARVQISSASWRAFSSLRLYSLFRAWVVRVP